MSQFIDQVRLKIRSGDGGNGIVAWRREKYEPLGGPAGGTGGRGGHVILEAKRDMSTLLDFHYKSEFQAKPGGRGGPKNRHGADGPDLVLSVPVGTVVRDLESGRVVCDLNFDGARSLVAEGGRGGRGNHDLASQNRRAPHYCEPGEAGIERHLELTLKMMADVGLIGMPNAGKSSLLSLLTSARPKIADYPFSTLSPNLGVMKKPDGDAVVLADIPGLVSGASTGVGLGHTFLRHIERTRILVHLADISSESLERDLKLVCQELSLYEPRLAEMKQIVFLNKSDLLPPEKVHTIAEDVKQRRKEIFPNWQSIERILLGSCATRAGINDLRNCILELAGQPVQPMPVLTLDTDEDAYRHPGSEFTVARKKNIFYVSGTRVEKLVSVTNLRSPESCQHLFHVLRAMGIIDRMLELGLEAGHEVVIAKTSFSYGEEMF